MRNTLDRLVEEMGIAVADCVEIPTEELDEEMTVESRVCGRLTSVNCPTQETADSVNWFLGEGRKIKEDKSNDQNVR